VVYLCCLWYGVCFCRMNGVWLLCYSFVLVLVCRLVLFVVVASVLVLLAGCFVLIYCGSVCFNCV